MARTGKRVNRPTALVFGDVKLGNVMSRVVFLTNESDVPVSWQFVVEDKGTFQFDRTYGVIPPKLEAHVIVRFEPEVSGNFYRRIFCLVKNQLPLAIDCVAILDPLYTLPMLIAVLYGARKRSDDAKARRWARGGLAWGLLYLLAGLGVWWVARSVHAATYPQHQQERPPPGGGT